MNKSNLKERTARAQRALKESTTAPAVTIRDWLERYRGEFARVLPKVVDPDRLIRVTLTVVNQTPGLAQCHPRSIIAAVMQLAQLGLEPGVLGQAWLVPYKDKVTPIIGYPGYIRLAYRSGQVASIVAREVCEGDDWQYWFDETGDHFIHRPGPGLRRQETLRGVYLVVRFKDGGLLFDHMDRDQIESVRARSPSARKESSPWNHPEDYVVMAKKSVIRRNWRYLPFEGPVAGASQIDEQVVSDWHGDGSIVTEAWEADEPAPPAPPPATRAPDAPSANAPGASPVTNPSPVTGQPPPASPSPSVAGDLFGGDAP